MMNTLTINIPDTVEEKTVKTILKALGVTFEKPKEQKTVKKEQPYNPEFVAKILEGRQHIAEGKTVKVSLDEIWK